MGQGQDPYDEAGSFTPYQPSPPSGEPSGDAPSGEVPFVPYGSASPTAYHPVVTTTSKGVGRFNWLVAIGVVVATCGGIVAGIVGFVSDLTDDSPSDTAPEIAVPEVSISIPDFSLPPIEVPSVAPQVFANDLQGGQCLIGVGFEPSSNQGISHLEVTGCARSHNAQVLEVNVLSEREAAEYDFDDRNQGNVSCFPLFSRAQKALFEGDRYTLLSFTETATPQQGDKVACLVVRTDGTEIRGFLPRP